MYANRNVINIVYSDNHLLEKNLNEVIRIMKKNAILKKNIDKNIDFYISNFFNSDIPDIKNEDNINILWLGSINSISISNIKKFDYILVSTYDLYSYLEKEISNIYYIPMFAASKSKIKKSCSIKDNNPNCYWVVIGEAVDFISYLKKHNIRYKQYTLANEKVSSELMKDLGNISGIAANNIYLNFNSLDISPFFFAAASANIPITTYKETHKFNLLTFFFNNSIIVYSSYDDIALFFENQTDTSNAKVIVDNYFTPDAIAEIIISILTKTDYNPSVIDNMVDVWCASKPSEYSNGDFSFSYDLLKNITSKYKSISNPASIMQHIGQTNIFIRGMISFSERDLNKKGLSIIYLLYPAIDNFKDSNFSISLDEYISSIEHELKMFDGVVVASSYVHKGLEKIGIKSHYIPQFTDTNKFYFDPVDELKSEVLFVGTRYFDRPSIPILLANNIKVDIYGPNWSGLEKAESIDNRILRKYYSSAKIVLNDTRPDMKQLNFISNRIFDATACGSFVISDYIPEVEEVYGDSVPMWKTPNELVELVRYYLDPKNEKERLEKANRAREITLKNFTADIAGKKFDKVIEELKKQKGM